MKRYIYASRDIEYKIKDYIAAWAKDDVKEGKPMANFREFKEEMKAEGLKADEDVYDYYVACYNNASKSLTKKVKASKEIIEPWNDPEVEYVCNTNGWWCYRKIEDGRGKWYAHEQDTPEETMIPVTYAQVRGYEPMPNASSIWKLQRELGQMLLPPEGYVGAASKADATNELSADLLNAFEKIVGNIWTIVESTNGNYMVVSEDVFDEQEADRMVIKLNNELKRLGISKHVSSVKYYYAGGHYEERPLRVMMTLKKYVEI